MVVLLVMVAEGMSVAIGVVTAAGIGIGTDHCEMPLLLL